MTRRKNCTALVLLGLEDLTNLNYCWNQVSGEDFPLHLSPTKKSFKNQKFIYFKDRGRFLKILEVERNVTQTLFLGTI